MIKLDDIRKYKDAECHGVKLKDTEKIFKAIKDLGEEDDHVAHSEAILWGAFGGIKGIRRFVMKYEHSIISQDAVKRAKAILEVI